MYKIQKRFARYVNFKTFKMTTMQTLPIGQARLSDLFAQFFLIVSLQQPAQGGTITTASFFAAQVQRH